MPGAVQVPREGPLPHAGRRGEASSSWGSSRLRNPATLAHRAVPAPLVLDLVAAVLRAGAPPSAALASVGAALMAAGYPGGEELLLLAGRLRHCDVTSGLPSNDLPSDRRDGAAAGQRAQPQGREPRHGRRQLPGSQRWLGRAQLSGRRQEPWLARLEAEFRFAAAGGMAPAALIRRAAGQQRLHRRTAQLRAVRRLEVLLVLPTGLCLLPAFILLGIAPLVLGLIAR